MRLLVLDNYGSFTLVPYLQERLQSHEIFTMGNLGNEQMWNIFFKVAPDIVFVDFCNENAVNLTQRVRGLSNKPKIVIRLHGYEAQSWFLDKIEWSVVSALIVVSPKFKEILESKLAVPNNIIQVVPNGIDLQKFQLQYEDEMDETAIAYAGYFNKKKGPTLLRTIMASVPEMDFHLAGTHQDEQVKLYMEDLDLSNVTYYGWVETGEFLKGKRFILSTSVTESFGMSIGEGMAMGLTPVVHGWPGADLVWPKECIWNTFDELNALLDAPKNPEWCRKWVEERYSIGNCIDQVTRLLGFTDQI